MGCKKVYFSIFRLNLYRKISYLTGCCLRLNDKSFSIQQGFWRWSMNMTCLILFLKFEYRTLYDRSIQRLLLLYIVRTPLSSTPRPYSYISVNASFQLQKIMHYFRYPPGLMAARLGEYTNMFFLAGLVSHPRRDREEPRGPRFIGYWGLFPPIQRNSHHLQPHFLWGKYNKSHCTSFKKRILDFNTINCIRFNLNEQNIRLIELVLPTLTSENLR